MPKLLTQQLADKTVANELCVLNVLRKTHVRVTTGYAGLLAGGILVELADPLYHSSMAPSYDQYLSYGGPS
jgi:hypothetical protein